MNPETVIISGAGGFVGGAIAAHYSDKGIEVRNFSRSKLKEIPTTQVDLAESKPRFSPGNLEQTVLVHCAASMNTSNLDEMWGANVAGTANLLRWATDQKIGHVILVSSGGVYPYRNDYAWSERDEVDPIGHYGYTKFMSDNIAQMHPSIDGLPVTVLRLFFPFDLAATGGMGRMFTNRLRQNLDFQINEGGKPAMNPVYIEDFVDLVSLAVQRGGGNGYEIFNAGGVETLTFLDMCRFFEKETGKTAKLKQTGDTQQDLIGSIEKARIELGWNPTFRFNS